MLLELFEALVCPAQVLSSLHLANAVWPTRHETSFRVPLHPTGEEPSASVPATAVWCCVTHQFVASVPLRHQRQGIDHHKHRACVLVLFAEEVQHRAEAVRQLILAVLLKAVHTSGHENPFAVVYLVLAVKSNGVVCS